MKLRLAFALLCIGLWAQFPAAPLAAGVIVIANRAGQDMRFTLTPARGAPQEYTLAPRDLVAVPADGTAVVSFAGKGKRLGYELPDNTAYYFGDFAEGPDLKAIAFTSAARPVSPGKAPAPRQEAETLPLKILVDEVEPTVQPLWEKRLRRRVQDASLILERHCRVRLAVVAVGTWPSADLADLPELLADFRRKVQPPPGGVAVGFTSRRVETEGVRRLGGIRMPLQGHILCREWSPRTEPEKLEVLLHELGHYLGAAHSPEPDSVMRPTLGDGRARAQNAHLGYDPLNTLAMNLLAEERRTPGVRDLTGVSPAARDVLVKVYAEIARALPKDPLAARYLRLLGQEAEAASSPGR